ncbi:MAG TPA: hypothetical protein PLR88_08270 [Bacteroidales bacterium]|nr:hypothetical protein [Bacteroidales bacterium]
MKTIRLTFILFLIVFAPFFYNCSRTKIKDIPKSKNDEIIKVDSDLKYDNEVINQTINSIIDSLDNQIRINLGKDYNKYTKIYVGDSIIDYGSYYLNRNAGISIDSINLNKKGREKLNIVNRKLHNNKEIKLISSYKEYSDLVSFDSTNRVLLAFSRVHFNKKYNEGVFTVIFSCSSNSGIDYNVYVKREGNQWCIKSIIETAIR